MSSPSINSVPSTNTSTITTILTIQSFNPSLDANYIQDLLLRTSLEVTGSILIENYYNTNSNNEQQQQQSNRNENITPSLPISIWMSSLNTMIVIVPDMSSRSTIEQQNELLSSSSMISTCWTVPETLYQELLKLQQQQIESNNSYIRIELPSKCSQIIIIPYSYSIQNTNERMNIIQTILSINDQISSSSSKITTTDPKELVDIPLIEQLNVKDIKDDKNSPLPIFPSLESKILTINSSNDNNHSENINQQQQNTPITSQLSYQPMTLNSRTPIPFETELFHGQMIMILRPPQDAATIDPFWYERIFEKKKRRCIITIQGKFKSIPQGILYAGAEISQPMRLGLVTKGVCTILLKLVERFNTNIHSSFGIENNENPELNESAHIVAPAYTFFEKLIQTPMNEIPPNILNEIEESDESLQLRKKNTNITSTQSIWNTTDTYTFSFYSMYIDLPTWQLVGLPASGDIGLQTFWGSSLLRICMYDKTNGITNDKRHLQSKNRYAFSVQLQYLGKNGEKRKQKVSSSSFSPTITRKSISINGSSILQLEDEMTDEDSQNTNKDNIFYTDRRLRHTLLQHQQQTFTSLTHSESQLFPTLNESGESSFDESLEGKGDDYDEDDLPFYDAKQSHSETTEFITTTSLPSRSIAPHDNASVTLLMLIDQYCPYWIEICQPSRNGGSVNYVTMFACRLQHNSPNTTLRLESTCIDLLNSPIGSTTSTTIVDVLDTMMNENFSSRLSTLEKIRRYLGLALSDRYGENYSMLNKIVAFRRMNALNPYETEFLQVDGTKFKPSVSSTVRLCGYIARAYSDRHWVEEWVCLHERHITFRQLDKRKGTEFVLLLSNIINVYQLSPDLCPYNTKYPILVLSTVASTSYLMFASETILANWRQIILQGQQQRTRKGSDNESNGSFDCNNNNSKIVESLGASADDFLHKSSMWNCKNRRILNCTMLHFRSVVETTPSISPITIAEIALRKATELSMNGVDHCSEQQLHDFLVNASNLKQAHVVGLDDITRLAFYLNVYHAMISHAYLVLGPPDSSLKWINYFNNIAYQVGDDIFSLTELEHSIIRANMSFPTQFLSRFVIPKSSYPLLALKINDYRINFALNCGSLSNPSKIIIYQPEHLNEQLDIASRLYITSSVTFRRTGSGDLELKLPRICQWFSDDFGSSRSEMLSAIEPYLPVEARRQLDDCRIEQFNQPPRFDMSSIIIRFHSYNFECRPLSIM